MSRAKSRLTALQLRKRLLLAESELNRTQLIHDWDELSHHAQEIGSQARKAGSIASTAALIMGAVGAYRQLRSPSPTVSSSGGSGWAKKILNGAKIAASLYMLVRARTKDGEENESAQD